MTDNTARPCAECRWFFRAGASGEWGQCTSPKGALATTAASYMRGKDIELCGPEGKWFEPKESAS